MPAFWGIGTGSSGLHPIPVPVFAADFAEPRDVPEKLADFAFPAIGRIGAVVTRAVSDSLPCRVSAKTAERSHLGNLRRTLTAIHTEVSSVLAPGYTVLPGIPFSGLSQQSRRNVCFAAFTMKELP